MAPKDPNGAPREASKSAALGRYLRSTSGWRPAHDRGTHYSKSSDATDTEFTHCLNAGVKDYISRHMGKASDVLAVVQPVETVGEVRYDEAEALPHGGERN